jgi:hypothetical protein
VLKAGAALAAFLACAGVETVQAQYPRYPVTPQYTPYQPPAGPYQQPGTNIQGPEGNWFLFGAPEAPCQIIPSRLGDRALFINEHGDRVEGFIRGNRILVPKWRVQGIYEGDSIQWSNNTVWTR